jgi:drug/metabolite transporter (DMT)-like permease
MLAVVLALMSAIGFGASDFTAGLATRATSVIRVTILAEASGAILAALIVPWVSRAGLSSASAGWGAAAGAAGVTGAMVLYLGFRNAEFSVASTLSAVASAVLSMAAGLLLGERPDVLALTGIALALPAIAAVSASPHPVAVPAPEPGAGRQTAILRSATGRHAVGVGYGLGAGVCFALYFITLNRAGPGSGLWPVLVAQLVSLVIVVGIGAATRELRLPPAGARWPATLTGTVGVAGTTLFFIASHKGLLAVTAVITALYPGGTILLARALLGERLTWVRLVGLGLAGASVALIAVAQAS